MTPLLVIAALAAGPVKVAVPGLTSTGLSTGEGEAYSDHLAGRMQQQEGLQVSTAKDIATVLGIERQKALLGCSDTSCIAELAGALGADTLLLGSVTKVGSGYLVTMKLVKTKDGSAFAVVSERVAHADALLALIDQTAAAFGDKLRGEYGVEGGSSFRSVYREKWWVPALIGAILAAFGGTGIGFAHVQVDQVLLRTGDFAGASLNQATAGIDAAILTERICYGLLGIGAVVLLASIVLRLVL